MYREDGYAGCILGQALGDALGFMVEGYPPAICRDYVETVIRREQLPEGDRAGFTFGQYSDDTQLARTLMESYAGKRGFDPADFAARLASLFAGDRVVGRGRATEKAAFRLARGVPWDQAGEPPPSAGNGSAMRAGPVGLFFPNNAELRRRAARDQSRVTHQDPRCSAGSAVIAEAVAWGLGNSGLDAGGLIHDAAAAAQLYDGRTSECVDNLRWWREMTPSKAIEAIAEASERDVELNPRAGVTPYVVSSVLWSMYAFLRTPDDYLETISVAIAVGGDVDTTAAMAGAVSGAYNGVNALPNFYLTMLNDQGEWREHHLRHLARDVRAIALGEIESSSNG